MIRISSENGEPLWVVFVKDPESADVANSYVGLMRARDINVGTYAIQLFDCDEIAQNLATQCVFDDRSKVISAARLLPPSDANPHAIYTIRPVEAKPAGGR
ncbi:MAG: hypothetical protein MUF14_06340 [Hyphomonadaceae bacterium]|nr:hypothetical protein [Hyphomonadaceae bacterium]